MPRILTLTMNPALDKSTHVDNVAPNRKLRATQPRVDPGGGGINVARAIHRMGGEALAIYPAGGLVGEALNSLLDEAGVPYQLVNIQQGTRENITIFEDATNQEFRFNMPGATLTEQELQRCIDTVFTDDRASDYLVASGSLPPEAPDDFYAQLAHRAHACGCRLIVDTSGEALRQAAEVGVYALKPNMRELRQLAGREIESDEVQEVVTRDLIERGKAEIVLLTLGAAGALLVTEDLGERIRAPTVTIRSKIGAGDCTVAGFTLALARGKSVREAAYYGVAAGSAAVMTPGTELCRDEDVRRLFRRIWSGEG